MASPVGPLVLTARGGAIVSLEWCGAGGNDPDPVLDEAVAQLQDYFADRREVFDLPLALDVSASQMRLLEALQAIPFGETRTYGELASELGVSAQAVGQMCGANPIPIIIPCHRVLGAQSLGGFSAPDGIETKVALLRHEGAAGLLI